MSPCRPARLRRDYSFGEGCCREIDTREQERQEVLESIAEELRRPGLGAAEGCFYLLEHLLRPDGVRAHRAAPTAAARDRRARQTSRRCRSR
jgi:hypothetical protein